MFEELTKLILLTGSQISLCEIRNDAKDNLITGLMIAGTYRYSNINVHTFNIVHAFPLLYLIVDETPRLLLIKEEEFLH